MNEHLVDQLEFLFSGNLQGNRLARSLPVLCGCLAGGALPDPIREKLAVLSRQVLLQDVFDTLVNALNQFTKTTPSFHPDPAHREPHGGTAVGMAPLIEQIEQARRELSNCEVANQSEIIAWIVAQAKEQKLWGRSKRR
jgi:hypothetical protein